MVKVAVAGGTSPTLGRSIVEAILATNGRHDVIILSRASNEASTSKASSTKYGAQVVPVDYDSVSSLADTFKKHGIHTIISVIKVTDPKASMSYHENLLAAAQQTHAARLILSDWSMGPLSHKQVEMLAHKDNLHQMGVKHMKEAEEKGQWKVECSTIQNGMFMEYLVQGCEPPGGDESKLRLDAGLVDDLMLEYMDVANKKLVAPCKEDGTPSSISTTSIRDIGTYVAAALDLPPGKLVGQVSVVSKNLLSMFWVAEVLKNKCNWNVTVDTIVPSQCDKIQKDQKQIFENDMKSKGEFNLSAFLKGMVAEMEKVACLGELGGGVLDIEGKPSLNRLCPEAKPTKVEELLVKAWGSRS